MRFLCIDDDPLNLQVLTDMLQVAGGSADAFTSGAAGLDALDAGTYDMLLVDLRMPDMDGVAFIERVRGRLDDKRAIPIIVLTAEGRESEVKRCRTAGADSVLAKPVMMDALFEGLGTVLAHKSIGGDIP
jgi:two-component system response regulator QseB